MANPRQENTGAVLLAALLGIVIGGVGGFYVQFWTHRDARPEGGPAVSQPGGPQVRAEQVRPMPLMAGGGPAVMGAGTQPGATLARTVRYLSVLQSAQGKGLTADQAKKLLPTLKELQRLDTLPPAEAEKRLDAVMQTLTEEQRRLLQALSPFGPPGSGGASASRMPATRPTVPMAAGLSQAGGGGAMSGGAGTTDPERPFASERNRSALNDLIGLLEKVAR